MTTDSAVTQYSDLREEYSILKWKMYLNVCVPSNGPH